MTGSEQQPETPPTDINNPPLSVVILLAGIAILVVFAIFNTPNTSASPSETEIYTATPVPTDTQLPQASPSPTEEVTEQTPEATFEIEPADTATNSITPTPTLMACMIRVIRDEVWVRRGPGVGYLIAYDRLQLPIVNTGDELLVIGVSTDTLWLKVHVESTEGWIGRSFTAEMAGTDCTDIEILADRVINSDPIPSPTNAPILIVQPLPSNDTGNNNQNTNDTPPIVIVAPPIPIVATAIPTKVLVTVDLGGWCNNEYSDAYGGFEDISFGGGQCHGTSEVDGDDYSIDVNLDEVCRSQIGDTWRQDHTEGSTLYCTTP